MNRWWLTLVGLAWIAACADEPMAKLRPGNGGANHGSGTTPGNSDGGNRTDGGLGGDGGVGFYGEVTFLDEPQGPDAGALGLNQLVARFYSDAAPLIPAECAIREHTSGATLCKRYDCDVVDSAPRGALVSAGPLTLTGLTGLDALAPQDSHPPDTLYPLVASGAVPFWQAGSTLRVDAPGEEFPAFSAEVVTLPPVSLIEPLAEADGRFFLSRSEGFRFRVSSSVETLFLRLIYNVPAPFMLECSGPATNGELTVSPDALSDLPDDALPQGGAFYAENTNRVDVEGGEVIVSARRPITDATGAQLLVRRFVTQP